MTTIIAADYRPVHDRLCPITMLLQYFRDEPEPQTFHPLSFLHLSSAKQGSRSLRALSRIGRWLHFQLPIHRDTANLFHSQRIKENGWPYATCASKRWWQTRTRVYNLVLSLVSGWRA